MRLVFLLLVVCLFLGCQPPPPPPVVPPAPEDLSVWTVPTLVQPEPVLRPSLALLAPKVPAGTAEKVVDYTPGVAVEVPVALGQPLDVVLEAGEQVKQIVDGDRAPVQEGQSRPWEVKEGGDGTGDTLRPHVFVTVTEAGLRNGVTITTTKRTYYLTCQSVHKSPVRVLRWTYPADRPARREPSPHAPGLLPDPDEPRRYHVGFVVTANRTPPPPWIPRQIVDDGKKTYILYPEVTLFETVPLVRAVGPSGPMLLNSRQFLNVVILDQLVGHLELRVGTGEQADVVTITRERLHTITCPGDSACPVWPAAAAILTRSTP